MESNDLKGATIASNQSGKGYETISKLSEVHQSTVRKTVHQRKTFKTGVNLPRVDIPANPSESKTEDAQRNCKEELHVRLCKQQSKYQMLKFRKVPFALDNYGLF